MADDNRADFLRRSVRKVSQNSYIQLRNAKTELREKVRKVSEVLRKPEHERSCADKALVTKNPEIVKTSQKNAQRLKENKDRLLEIEDEPTILAEKCERLADLIKMSEHVVVYTGAGISTAASIPDYRGPNGVWTLLKKGQELCPQDLSDAEPTYTHMSLTKLFRVKKVKHVVSQNCDGLHIRSGFPRYSLSELHGNMYIEMCYNCAPHREYVRLFDVTERTSVRRHTTARRCRACGVNLTDTIVHFGEKGKIRSPYRWKEAVRAAKKADLILCLGSSLKVLKKYQCLWCMDKKPHLRPKLAIVNLQWTPKDDVASLKINGRCDSVMRMVMKLLDQEVPEYQRELDPIFRICTPLRANEAKTTNKKILIPPSLLSKPPRQGKSSKMKATQPSETQTEQSASCRTRTESGAEAPMDICPDGSDTIKVTFSSEAESSPLNNRLPTSSISTPGTLTQFLGKESISSILQVSTSEVSPKGNCAVSIIDLTSVCQIKSEPHGMFSSAKNHLLNPLPLTTPLTHTGATVATYTAAASPTEEVLRTSAQVTDAAIEPSEPIVLKSWPSDFKENDFEQMDLTTSSHTLTFPPEADSLPTIVVVNLDMPAEPATVLHSPVLTGQENANSSSLLNSHSTSVSSSNSLSHFLDISKDVSPFPVLLTYVNDLGEPQSIPVNSVPQPTEDSFKPTSKSTGEFEKNVSLDHSYFQDSWDGSKMREPSSFPPNKSIISLDASVEDLSSTSVPSNANCDTSNSGLIEHAGVLNGKINLSKSLKITDGIQSFLSTPDLGNTDIFTPAAVCNSLSGNVSAPMCVLNMDEMETVYSLPEEPPHFLGPIASSSKAWETEDVTLELELPAGCEILTMDMLSAHPGTWALSDHSDLQGLDQRAAGRWQTPHPGTVLKAGEPFINSILSSDLEPVVCNLAVSNVQKHTKKDFAGKNQVNSTKVLSLCLDDGTISGLKQIDQHHVQEFPKSVRSPRGHNCGELESHENLPSHNTNKVKSSVEERIPLSPRSSKLLLSSQSSRMLPSLPTEKSTCETTSDKPLISCAKKYTIAKSETKSKEPKVRKMSHNKNLTKAISNHVKVEGKQVGLENICKKVSSSKCSPSSVPGWFGKGLGLKKKRK
ncbi:hypothetical protein EGW08_002523 [Elysia chlorotica]|uniref:protein acetyllysine N-acetyltransferase n=1 Tax=Elysia chlorotica TaxID=188477 RepID=A0A433U798_ELYCH|nr:hypothetical protein EGW08_002523 [Elysia chlorotica]